MKERNGFTVLKVFPHFSAVIFPFFFRTYTFLGYLFNFLSYLLFYVRRYCGHFRGCDIRIRSETVRGCVYKSHGASFILRTKKRF
jgi:hypothetical protein